MKPFNISEIDRLLVLYYDGMTTIEEEQYLRIYFMSSKDIPERLYADRDVFLAISQSGQSEYDLPENFEQDIIDVIDSCSVREELSPRRFNYRILAGLVASFVVIIGLGWHLMHTPSHSNEISDPDLAYIETVKAINLLSQKLNKANSGIIQTQNTIIDINNEVNSILK